MNPLTDDSPMPFGKYSGEPMQDVPVEYLHWYWHAGNNSNTPVGKYIKENIMALKKENNDLIWDLK